MTRIAPHRFALAGLLGVFLLAGAGRAGGIDDFSLTKAVPADAMIAVHWRDHDGLAFLNTQFERVWAEVEKQKFDRDIRRIFLTNIKQQGGDPNSFEVQWQQLTDLAAGVEWSTLGQREGAMAMKLTEPIGAEFVFLVVPPADRVESDFTGLAALAKGLSALGGEAVTFAQEGSGGSQTCKIAINGAPAGLGIVLAREKDVLVFGWGTTLAEQSLAMLRGEADASAPLTSTDRFKVAFKELPPPTDALAFIDIAKLMGKSRDFMAMMEQMAATTQPETQPAVSPMKWLTAVVEELDIWEYHANVSTTRDKRTETHGVTLLKPNAMSTTVGKTFYSNKPVKDPLKMVPKVAKSVSANSGMNWRTFYEGAVDFVKTKVPDGEAMITQWNEVKTTLPIDLEKDVLSWFGGRYVTYSAPIPTPFNPGSVFILPAEDAGSLTTFVDKAGTLLNSALQSQGAGVEDANMPGLTGFKRIIMPPFFMMIPGIGRPIYGVRDGNLWIGNGPEIVAAGMSVADGSAEDFTKNEQYQKEGLPIEGPVTAFAFTDLTTLGDELSQIFAMAGMIPAMGQQLGPIAKDPVFMNLMTMVSKVGNVVKKLDFFKSSCTIKTMEKGLEREHTVTHYQEPPKPKSTKTSTATAPAEEPAKPAEGEKKP